MYRYLNLIYFDLTHTFILNTKPIKMLILIKIGNSLDLVFEYKIRENKNFIIMEWRKIFKLPLFVKNVGRFLRNKNSSQNFDDALEFIAIILNHLGKTFYKYL